MKTLKEKQKEIRSGNHFLTKDVKEHLKQDEIDLKKLEHCVIMAIRFPNDYNFRDILDELVKYKNSRDKNFGDFENE